MIFVCAVTMDSYSIPKVFVIFFHHKAEDTATCSGDEYRSAILQSLNKYLHHLRLPSPTVPV